MEGETDRQQREGDLLHHDLPITRTQSDTSEEPELGPRAAADRSKAVNSLWDAGFLSPPSLDGTALSGPQMLPRRLRVAALLSSARYHGDRGEGRSEDVDPCLRQSQQR